MVCVLRKHPPTIFSLPLLSLLTVLYQKTYKVSTLLIPLPCTKIRREVNFGESSTVVYPVYHVDE